MLLDIIVRSIKRPSSSEVVPLEHDIDMISVSLYSRWSHKKVDSKHIANDHACFFCKSKKLQEVTMIFYCHAKLEKQFEPGQESDGRNILKKMVTCYRKKAFNESIDCFSICLYWYFAIDYVNKLIRVFQLAYIAILWLIYVSMFSQSGTV